MKKNLSTLSISRACSPSKPIIWTKFSTNPKPGLRGFSFSFSPPLKRKILAITSGILAIRFIASALVSPVFSAVPKAIIPIESHSIGWPLPGVRDSKTLSAPVGIFSPLCVNSARNSSDSSSVGNLLLNSKNITSSSSISTKSSTGYPT